MRQTLKFSVLFIISSFFINCSEDTSTNDNGDLNLSEVIIGDWFPANNENFSEFGDDGIGFGAGGKVYDLEAPGGTYEQGEQYDKKLEEDASYSVQENNVLIIDWGSGYIDEWEITIIDERTLRSNYTDLYQGEGPKYMKPIGLIRKVTN
ncbi:MAG: hypothetical protein K8R79_04705 [Calditrichales bacterium]|nr:hypothetical protein [Calditrichales bacterium]